MIYVMQLCESPRYVCKSRKHNKEVTFGSSRISLWKEIQIMSGAQRNVYPLMSNLLNDHDTCYEDFEL
jgi:hypothetical protein